MSGPLLTTKLFVPRPRAGTLVRARVSDLLDRGAATKLTLVSAQAGFGKSTAIANWVHQRTDPGVVAWLSLDSGDTHPPTFWTYAVTALSAAHPDVGTGVLPLLEGQGTPTEAALTELLNRLAELDHDVVLVLDDYHLADSPDIADGLAFLLTHLPPQAHVVLATRTDPSLPLSRLRARGELVEIRAVDLRFTDAETSSYLHGAGVALDPAGPHSSKAEPRVGRPPSSWPSCRCRAETTSPASSPTSPVTTGSSSTTSSKRSSAANRGTFVSSCSAHPSSSASLARCATR